MLWSIDLRVVVFRLWLAGFGWLGSLLGLSTCCGLLWCSSCGLGFGCLGDLFGVSSAVFLVVLVFLWFPGTVGGFGW